MLSILLFSGSMLVGCYLAGCIPLAFNLSTTKLRLVTIFGAGLLLGTALTIIIPEGIHTMYTTNVNIKDHRRTIMNKVENNKVRSINIDNVAERMKLDNNEAIPLMLVHGDKSKEKTILKETHNDSHTFNERVHQKVGIILVLGFIFMLVVDHFSSAFNSNRNIDIDNTEIRKRSKSIPATIGLMVHSAADGIALGAASSMSHLHLEIIVFLAIMLHKGPAAFGFVSFLLHDNVERQKIRRYLLVFSLAAPVMSIITFFCLSEGAKEYFQDINGTGIALLFSAGTFLYVATVHVLPELSSNHQLRSQSITDVLGDNNKSSNRSNIVYMVDHHISGFSFFELILIIFGSLLPLILSFGHSH